MLKQARHQRSRHVCSYYTLQVVAHSKCHLNVCYTSQAGLCCRYVVLNRPYAFVQWLQGAAITEKYVFMSEPDHIWLKPMPNLMVGQRPASFPFFYIEPSKTEFLPITQKFTGPLSRKQAEEIAPVGMIS